MTCTLDGRKEIPLKTCFSEHTPTKKQNGLITLFPSCWANQREHHLTFPCEGKSVYFFFLSAALPWRIYTLVYIGDWIWEIGIELNPSRVQGGLTCHSSCLSLAVSQSVSYCFLMPLSWILSFLEHHTLESDDCKDQYQCVLKQL